MSREMTARAASSAEMLAAVERWAKARGIFRLRHQTIKRYGPRPACPWIALRITADGVEIHHWDMATPWVVDPLTALLWACTVETTETLTSPPMRSEAEARAWAAARVMSGRMEIIRPQGVSARRPGEPREFVARVTRPRAVDAGKCPACVGEESKRAWGSKCPDCNGTGRELREVARLVLDAAEAVSEWTRYGAHVLAWMYFDEGGAWREEGMPARLYDLRDALHVAADQLQASGERLGTWHALGLAGKGEAAGEMVAWLSERPPGCAVPAIA